MLATFQEAIKALIASAPANCGDVVTTNGEFEKSHVRFLNLIPRHDRASRVGEITVAGDYVRNLCKSTWRPFTPALHKLRRSLEFLGAEEPLTKFASCSRC
jgi:hypothetical protein